MVDFQRAVTPLGAILAALTAGFEKHVVDEELQRHLRDVADHVTVSERIDSYRTQLRDILTLNSILVGQRQNEEVEKISSWAAVLFAPSLVSGIYGMNSAHMPETAARWGYPFALVLVLVLSVTLYVAFRRRGWL